MTSNFPMFKFPDATKVIIRCTVVVCNKNCPVAKCDQEDGGSNPGSDFLDVNVLDKFYLDTFAQYRSVVVCTMYIALVNVYVKTGLAKRSQFTFLFSI